MPRPLFEPASPSHDSRTRPLRRLPVKPTGRFLIRWIAITLAAGALLVSALPARAAHYPRRVPKRWHAPAWFLRDALCVHSHEGAWPDNTGNTYFGGLQFLIGTWESVGGRYFEAFSHPGDRRYPFTARPREQLYRMWLVYLRDGHSFHEWGTAGMCGLR